MRDPLPHASRKRPPSDLEDAAQSPQRLRAQGDDQPRSTFLADGRGLAPGADARSVSLRVVNHISAMVAYWDAQERCVFSNEAYREWFGRSPQEMMGMTLKELLGPIYEKNLPYIRGALAGTRQSFERQIPLPGGGVRDSIATYTPDIVDGVVLGFSVHVADVTELRQREATLAKVIEEAIVVLEKTKRSFQSKELGKLREQLLRLTPQRADGPPAAPSGKLAKPASLPQVAST